MELETAFQQNKVALSDRRFQYGHRVALKQEFPSGTWRPLGSFQESRTRRTFEPFTHYTYEASVNAGYQRCLTMNERFYRYSLLTIPYHSQPAQRRGSIVR